jgi:hypothetical protein
VGFWSNILAKVASIFCRIYGLFWVFSPLSHFFSLIGLKIKNISNSNIFKKIKRIAIKSGFLTKTLKKGGIYIL